MSPSRDLASASPAADDDVPIGKEFGPWRVVALIGRGGYASVYKCQHRLQKARFAAVKVLLPTRSQKADSRTRFFLEIQIQTKLKNPNVVEIYDADMLPDGTAWMAMELLEGKTLDELLEERGRITVVDGLKIMSDIADGMQAAHDLGVVHRDLKPLNIFITTNSVVKVIDYGVAKLVENRLELEARTTDKNRVPGSLPYMSPEQVSGKGVDYRSDIFSFGVVAFQVFTGTYPFSNEDGTMPDEAMTLVGRILMQAAPAPRDPKVGWERQRRDPPERGDALWSGVPYAVWMMVRRALEKNPADRYQSMAETKKEIIRLLAGHLMDENLPERPLLSGAPRAATTNAAVVPLAVASSTGRPPATPPTQIAHGDPSVERPREEIRSAVKGVGGTVPMAHISRAALASAHTAATRPSAARPGRGGTIPMQVAPAAFAAPAISPPPPASNTSAMTRPAAGGPNRASSVRAAGAVTLIAIATAVAGVAGLRLLSSRATLGAEPAAATASSAAPQNATPAVNDSAAAPTADEALAPPEAPPTDAVPSSTVAPRAVPAASAPRASAAEAAPRPGAPPVSSAPRRLGLPYESPKPPPTEARRPMFDRAF